jgi:hypothetical protein
METLSKIAAALSIGAKVSSAGQAYALLRAFLVSLGTLCALLGITWLSPEKIAYLIQVAQAAGGVIATLSAITGALLVLLPSIISSFKASTGERISDVNKIANDPQALQFSAKVALTKATDSLPEVMGVPTTNTPEGKALADAIPSNTVHVMAKS